MDHRHLEELMAVESSYWWHLAKRRLVLDLLRRHFPPPGRLIEGGVGAGANLAAFAGAGYQVGGLDVADAAIRHCEGLGLRDVQVHDLERPWPVRPGSSFAAGSLWTSGWRRAFPGCSRPATSQSIETA